MKVQVPLWSRVGILEGFSETKELLHITGDKSTKNKVVIRNNNNNIKNPCQQSPNHEMIFSQWQEEQEQD